MIKYGKCKKCSWTTCRSAFGDQPGEGGGKGLAAGVSRGGAVHRGTVALSFQLQRLRL